MSRWRVERGVALEEAKEDIANRIRRVCRHFDQDEFDALVLRMAQIEVYYRTREDWLTSLEMGTLEVTRPTPPQTGNGAGNGKGSANANGHRNRSGDSPRNGHNQRRPLGDRSGPRRFDQTSAGLN